MPPYVARTCWWPSAPDGAAVIRTASVRIAFIRAAFVRAGVDRAERGRDPPCGPTP